MKNPVHIKGYIRKRHGRANFGGRVREHSRSGRMRGMGSFDFRDTPAYSANPLIGERAMSEMKEDYKQRYPKLLPSELSHVKRYQDLYYDFVRRVKRIKQEQ